MAALCFFASAHMEIAVLGEQEKVRGGNCFPKRVKPPP
jgi:hypothetical protein